MAISRRPQGQIYMLTSLLVAAIIAPDASDNLHNNNDVGLFRTFLQYLQKCVVLVNTSPL